MGKRYFMKSDSGLEPLAVRGTEVFKGARYDYGLASDDTRITGVEHVSVTLSPDGDYPYFTVPRSGLKVVEEND